jgi:hypothetical protein
VQKTKEEQLQKRKEGKGHWEEGLASDSESIVCLSVVFFEALRCAGRLRWGWHVD